MSFTDKQIALLAADLNRANVKSRSQAGRSLSYIESWHAIAEANRIFGYDGWSSETVDIRVVSERERKVGARQIPGWGVTYIAKVRVEAGGVVREGVGSGHGIDVDLGQAHESAIKEAESDARKRALMTFGNQFGLALYDKEQRNVSDGEPVDEIPHQEPKKEAAPQSTKPQQTNSAKADAASVPAAPSKSRIADKIPAVPPTQHPVPGHGQFNNQQDEWKQRELTIRSKREADKALKALTAIEDDIGAAEPAHIAAKYAKWVKDTEKVKSQFVGPDIKRVADAVRAFKVAAEIDQPAHDEDGVILERSE